MFLPIFFFSFFFFLRIVVYFVANRVIGSVYFVFREVVLSVVDLFLKQQRSFFYYYFEVGEGADSDKIDLSRDVKYSECVFVLCVLFVHIHL